MSVAELKVDARAELGEGPVWDDRTNTVVWVDIPTGQVHRYDPLDGHDEVIYQALTNVGCVALHQDGLLIAAGLQLLVVRDNGSVVDLAEVRDALPGHTFNDGAVDPQGRMVVGTVGPTEDTPTGRLYRLEHDGCTSVLLDGLMISNGLDWSIDNSTMYFIDSPQRLVQFFDYGDALTNRQAYVACAPPGVPDGLCIDAEGCAWIAMYGAGCVVRFDPTGNQLATIELPVSQVTSCCFGGTDLDLLYISTASENFTSEQRQSEPYAGGLFLAAPNVRGRTARRCLTSLR